MTPHRTSALLLWAVLAILGLLSAQARAEDLTFTVTASEPVTVTGSPRIAIDVGGVTRHATYVSGTGTAALTFAYQVQPGDFDADGITIQTPQVQLNGGTIRDVPGNDAVLSFTAPDTTGVRVQTYTAAFTTLPITGANANAVGFRVDKAPVGASFTYTISSSGGTGTIGGSGTIGSGNTASVTGVNVSALAMGTLTLSVQVSVTNQGQGQPATATAAPTASTALLDTLPATAAAYSVRHLRSAYTGSLLRVRRTSDNAERDVSATVAGNLDTATLSGFCGTGSCFVSTWYDQSGNGRHASQASTSLQPRIVNAGVIEADGGRTSVFFTGTTGARLISANALLNFSSSTIATVCRNMGTTTNIGGVIATGAGGWGLYYEGPTPSFVVDGSGANQGNSANTTGSNTTLVQLSATYASANTTNTSLYLNGSLAETFTGTGVGVSNISAPIEIGGRTWGNFPTRVFRGRISEAIVFADSLTNTDRQALERAQGDYFAIAIP